MQPRYAQLSSAGSTPWFPTDWWRNPMVFGISVVSSGNASWQIDVTMDDPTGQFPNPGLNPGQPAGAAPGQAGGRVVAVFPSTACAGGGVTPGSSQTPAIGFISQPIAAWRLTLVSSGTSPVTATVLQPGPR